MILGGKTIHPRKSSDKTTDLVNEVERGYKASRSIDYEAV